MARPESPRPTFEHVIQVQEKYEGIFMNPSILGKIVRWWNHYPHAASVYSTPGVNSDSLSSPTLHLDLYKTPTEKQRRKLKEGLEGVPLAYEVTGEIIAAED